MRDSSQQIKKQSANQMRLWLVAIIFLLALVGLFASVYLLGHHYGNRLGSTELPAADALCNINATFNCDTVDQSAYSKLLGFPVAGLGLLYYVIITIHVAGAFLFGIRQNQPKNNDKSEGFFSGIGFLHVLGPLSVAGFGFSVYFGLVSALIIKSLCPFCMVTYLVNFLVLVLIPFTKKDRPRNFLFNYGAIMLDLFFLKRKPQLKINRIFSLFTFVLVMGTGLTSFYFVAQAEEKQPVVEKITPDERIQKVVDKFYSKPAQQIIITDQPFLGDPGAKVTIVEFSDFQCPACQRASQILKPRIKKYKDQIAFYFFNYPLDMSCNPQIPKPFHPMACKAAAAALCAEQYGIFWEYHDALFANQKALAGGEKIFMTFAKLLGLNEDEFSQCLTSGIMNQRIASDIQQGINLQIKGTPAVFINGRYLREWADPAIFDTIIQKELGAAKNPQGKSPQKNQQPTDQNQDPKS